MARARNIKPSFFQNEELGELSPLVRLAFIGMWTIADFKGCLEFRPKRLKVQLIPYDECDIEEIAINLDKSGFIRIYSVAGQRYIKIINFEKHQNPHKNEREAGSEIPDYDEIYRDFNELEEIQINRDKNGTAPANSPFPLPDSPFPQLAPDGALSDFTKSNAPKKRNVIPYQKIVDLYHQHLPKCPKVEIISSKRMSQIGARWNSGELDTLESWADFFQFCSDSKFLMGATDPPPGRKRFVADLEWLTKESNYTKVVEGKYHG